MTLNPVTRPARIAQSFLSSAGTDLTAKVALLASTFIAVRSLDPIDFGIFLGLSAVGALANVLWDCGYSSLLTREFASGSISARDGLLQVARFRLLLLPAWAISFWAGLLVVDRGAHVPWLAVSFIALGSLATGVAAVTLGLLRANLRFALPGGVTVLGKTICAILSLAALPQWHFGDPFIVLSAAFVVGEFVTLAASSLALITGRGSHVFRARVANGTPLRFRSALPFVANSTLSLAYNRLDVVILAALSTLVQLSFYAPASRMQDALYLIPGAVSLVGLPMIARIFVHRSDDRAGSLAQARLVIRRLWLLGLGLSVPTAFAVYLLAPWLVRYGLGATYEGSVPSVRILIWFLPLAAIHSPLLAGLQAIGRAGDTTMVFGVIFIAAITMHLALDPRYGAIGASTASLLRDVVALPLSLFLAQRAGLLLKPGEAAKS